MNYMSKRPFDKLVERWKHIQPHLDDLGSFDKELVDVLHVFNSVEGLVTVWSCQGHPERKGHTSGYIMCGVRNRRAMAFLNDVFLRLAREYGNNANLVKLSTALRGDITVERSPEDKGMSWYNVWILGFGVSLQPHVAARQYHALRKATDVAFLVYQDAASSKRGRMS